MKKYFEIILKGFDGGTDKTDHLVKWVAFPNREALDRWVSALGLNPYIKQIGEIGEHENPPVDYDYSKATCNAMVNRWISESKKVTRNEIIELPTHGIVVHLKGQGGTVTSNLVDDNEGDDLHTACDVIEAMVLAHAVAGIDVKSPAYLEGLETVIDKVGNRYC